MSDAHAAALALLEHTVERVTSLEDDTELLHEVAQSVKAKLAELDEKVSNFVIETHKGIDSLNESMTLFGLALERSLEKRRTAQYTAPHGEPDTIPAPTPGCEETGREPAATR